MASRSIDAHNLRLAMYAEAGDARARRELAKVNARTQQMLDQDRKNRVENAMGATRRLRDDTDWLMTALGNDDIAAASGSTAGMRERINTIIANIEAIRAVEDALVVIDSEVAP